MPQTYAIESFLSGLYTDEYLAAEGASIIAACEADIENPGIIQKIKARIKQFIEWVKKLIDAIRTKFGAIIAKLHKVKNTKLGRLLPKKANDNDGKMREYREKETKITAKEENVEAVIALESIYNTLLTKGFKAQVSILYESFMELVKLMSQSPTQHHYFEELNEFLARNRDEGMDNSRKFYDEMHAKLVEITFSKDVDSADHYTDDPSGRSPEFDAVKDYTREYNDALTMSTNMEGILHDIDHMAQNASNAMKSLQNFADAAIGMGVLNGEGCQKINAGVSLATKYMGLINDYFQLAVSASIKSMAAVNAFYPITLFVPKN